MEVYLCEVGRGPMDLELERSRLVYNTASGKEHMPTRFRGQLPVNPFWEFSDFEDDVDVDPEYDGLDEVIRIQRENL